MAQNELVLMVVDLDTIKESLVDAKIFLGDDDLCEFFAYLERDGFGKFDFSTWHEQMWLYIENAYEDFNAQKRTPKPYKIGESIIVEVRGGVAFCTDPRVEIVDYDNLREEGCKLITDGNWTKIEDGVLLDAPSYQDGHFPTETEWGEVTAPEDQAFLDKVNAEFGTEFKMSQFAGR